MNTTFFKGIALANFVILLTAFLLYRNGFFDSFIYNNRNVILTSPNGGTSTQATKDSTIVEADSSAYYFSSSKSIVLTDDMKFLKDTTQKDSVATPSTEKKSHLMYSSKSGRIIDPSVFREDSLKKEKKSKKKKNKN